MIADIQERLESIGPPKGHAFSIVVTDDHTEHPRHVCLEEADGGEVLIKFTCAGLKDRFVRYAIEVLAPDYETIPGDGEEVALVVLPLIIEPAPYQNLED